MNVSPTTVANVIHGRTSKVSKENVERIQQALKEHNYVPKMGLEALTKGKTRLIIVVIHTTKRYTQTTVGDPFYSQTIGVLEEEIRSLYPSIRSRDCHLRLLPQCFVIFLSLPARLFPNLPA